MSETTKGSKPEKKPMIIRKATAADGQALNNLYNKVFKRDRSLACWRWKYPEGTAEDWPIVYSLAEVDGQIIGQYPSQLRSLSFQGKPIRFALVMDNIVAKEYRRAYPAQKEMFGYAVEAAKNNNIAIGYGFPNKKAYRIGKRLLGYRDVALLPELFYRLSWRPALARRLPWLPESLLRLLDNLLRQRNRFLQKLSGADGQRGTIVEVDRFSDELDQLWERMKVKRTICAERNSVFLNWRFGHADIIPYRNLVARDDSGVVVGYMVYRTLLIEGDKVGYLVDFLYETEAVLTSLLGHVLGMMNREKVDYVSVMVSPGTAEEASLKKSGFVLKEGFGGRPCVALDVSQTLPFEVICDPTQWYLTYGDSDLV